MKKGFWSILAAMLMLVAGCTAASEASPTAHPRPSRSLATSEMAATGNVAKLGRAYRDLPVVNLPLVKVADKDGLTSDGCLKYWRDQENAPVTGEGFYYESARVCFRQLAADRGVFVAISMKDGMTDQRVDNVGEPLDWEAKAAFFAGYELEDEAVKLYLPGRNTEVSVPMSQDLINGDSLRPDMVYVNGAALRDQDQLYIEVSKAMHDFLHYARPRY